MIVDYVIHNLNNILPSLLPRPHTQLNQILSHIAITTAISKAWEHKKVN